VKKRIKMAGKTGGRKKQSSRKKSSGGEKNRKRVRDDDEQQSNDPTVVDLEADEEDSGENDDLGPRISDETPEALAEELIRARDEVSLAAVADDLIHSRVGENTRRGYRYKLAHFKEWLKEKHPSLVDENDEILHEDMTYHHYTKFLAFRATFVGNTKTTKRNKFCSFEHLSAYKSAIQDDIHRQKMNIIVSVVVNILLYLTYSTKYLGI
jgi:hypothetical protein